MIRIIHTVAVAIICIRADPARRVGGLEKIPRSIVNTLANVSQRVLRTHNQSEIVKVGLCDIGLCVSSCDRAEVVVGVIDLFDGSAAAGTCRKTPVGIIAVIQRRLIGIHNLGQCVLRRCPQPDAIRVAGLFSAIVDGRQNVFTAGVVGESFRATKRIGYGGNAATAVVSELEVWPGRVGQLCQLVVRIRGRDASAVRVRNIVQFAVGSKGRLRAVRFGQQIGSAAETGENSSIPL